MGLFNKIFGSYNDRELKKIYPIADAIEKLEPEYAALKEKLGLDENSVVLCFSTEGDTDPVHYRKIVYEGKNAMPQEE